MKDLPYFQPQNRRLLCAVAAMTLGVGAAWFGPAARQVDASAHERATKQGEFEKWQEDFRAYRPISAQEREEWQRSFEGLRAWIPDASDEPRLVAEVARAFQSPSTRDLQVQKGEPLDARTDAPPATFELAAPHGDGALLLRSMPLAVQLRCSYADLYQLLGRLERKEIPARVDAVHLKRLSSDIEVRMELVFFVRERVTP